jgi:dUTP pyrophosphatase
MDYSYLYIWIEDTDLKEKYKHYVKAHNDQVTTNFPNAGFDLLCPEEMVLPKEMKSLKLNTKIICAMSEREDLLLPLNYYLFPRSSISKTPLRLANSVGIIDSGYRGDIIGVFDKFDNVTFTIEKHSRLLQICSPTLKPLIVKLVDNLND